MPTKPSRGPRPKSTPPRSGRDPLRGFAVMVRAGSRCYVRERDLPKLVSFWPHEIEDGSAETSLRIIGKLRRALRAERNLGRAGHWSYDLNRHLALLGAYRAELAYIGQRERGPATVKQRPAGE